MNTNKIYAEHIANEYSVKKESKVVALKKIDKKAKLPSEIFAYSFGIIASLVFGLGMCLSMNIIGNGNFFLLGLVIGVLGLIGAGINYPIYKKILNNSKNKYASDIMRLAKEISEE